jgi:acyl-CoA reductase-like NAD-dependent aldehyde dehydrogenase
MSQVLDRVEHDRVFVGGEWVTAGGESVPVVSASTEEQLATVRLASEADVDRAVEAARAVFDDPQGWPRWEPARRAEAMERFAAELEKRGEQTARQVTLQNGMPWLWSSQIEAVFPALLLRYYGELITKHPAEEVRDGMLGGKTLVTREPVGVVGAIIPWNFPQGITFMKLAPALAAGCPIVLKPSPETVLDAYTMAEAAEAAGLPAGLVNIVPGAGDVGAYLVQHPRIDKVSFTGSTAVGRWVAETCGKLLRPVTLELGGKSAAILLDDVDLEKSAESMFGAMFFNSGQACWLNSRILAPRERYGEVVDFLSAMASSFKIGDPLDPDTQIGPMTSRRQRERVEGYIEKGRQEGAKVAAGGGRPAGLDRGWFVEPTIFADVQPDQTIAREEIFGPVLSVIPYDGVDEAVRIANDSEYGLGGSVWTGDPERGEQVARRVHSGTVGVNAYMNDPTAPFGGVKSSGMGRELGPEALEHYRVPKSVYLDPSA